MNQTLNYIAVKYQIKDEQGRLFLFKSHAFRHTKAVELLNNGMSLVLVQQCMAHASPEMTLIYAKILDETMRKAWEKAVHQGIVQFTDGKPEFVPGKKLLPMSGSNAFDPERVREQRQNIKMAPGSCLKTAKIICKFVESPCFHCPAYVLTPDDLLALEAYEQQILERIEIGKQAGYVHWIDVNQKNLDERVRPALALLRHMSEKSWKRNTAGLTAHTQLRKENKRKGVEDAITHLLREQKLIHFNMVAKAATVSKAYLYSQPGLRERIEALRLQGVEQTIRERGTQSKGKTDASRDLVILAKDRRIKALEAENQHLQRQLKGALAKAYDHLS